MEAKKQINPTSIRLSQEMYDKIVKMAEEEHRSLSKQIEHLLCKYFQMAQMMEK